MKRVLLPLAALFMLLVSSCEEQAPVIDLSEPPLVTPSISTDLSPEQNKAVLIEDITGVRCVNCPQAAQTAMSILASKTEDSVVAVALYSNDYNPTLTTPYSGFLNINSEFSSQIIGALGPPVGLPYGYIDRSKFGGSNRWIQPSLWLSKVNDRLKLKSPVNILLKDTVKKDAIKGDSLLLDFRLEYTSAVSGSHKYTLLITESGLISKQLTLSGENAAYIHNHVLRNTIGSATGNVLNATLVKGRVFEARFRYLIPKDYNIDNLHVVCIISDVTTEEVINVRQVSLKH